MGRTTAGRDERRDAAVSSLGALLAALDDELPAAVALRRRLHALAEPSHREERTAAAVVEALAIPVSRVAGTGVLARVGPAGPAVVVRAELDALPIGERTGAPYASRTGAMHACGHDVHAAALVALVRAVARLGPAAPAPLAALFQPSEEAYPSGAELVVAEGALPQDVLAVVGAHVHPDLAWGSLALDAGPVNASCDTLDVHVHGAAAHGAYPHLGADAVLALAQVVVAIHALVGRRVDPLDPAVVTVGEVHAGSAANIVAGEARARATVRAMRAETREELHRTIATTATGVAAAHGCSAEVTVTRGEPPLVNDEPTVALARSLAGAARFDLAPAWRSCGSDDFAFYRAAAPTTMAFVGLLEAPGFVRRPLHHPEFLPPDGAVGAVARALALLAVAAGAAQSTSR